jgi:hypothetical protein
MKFLFPKEFGTNLGPGLIIALAKNTLPIGLSNMYRRRV